MSLRDAMIALGASVVLAGCYDVHGGAADGEVAPDGGRADAGVSACGSIGGYRMCGERCPEECPLDAPFCYEDLGVCARRTIRVDEEPRGFDGCHFSEGWSPDRHYCWSGSFCAVVDPDADPVHGPCLSSEWCRAAAGAGIEARCMYSDGTPFVDGPPEVADCPPAPDADTPFCGGPCDACPFHVPTAFDPPSGWALPCVGLSETRGIGICGFELIGACSAERARFTSEDCERFYGRPCACLTFRDEAGLEQPRGWTTSLSSCRAYRAAFPDDVVCHDPETWVEI